MRSKRSSSARAQLTAGRQAVRAYRLYLAGSAMCFEQRWISLYQMLVSRPSGDVASGPMRGAQSAYPFNRSTCFADDQRRTTLTVIRLNAAGLRLCRVVFSHRAMSMTAAADWAR